MEKLTSSLRFAGHTGASGSIQPAWQPACLRIILALLAVILSACAGPDRDELAMKDPYENGNRKIYALNDSLDTALLEPAANAYRTSVPAGGQRAIANHVSWTGLPSTAVNSALQGKTENAGLAVIHFAINGLTLGFFDLLEEDEPRPAKEDFGQTLAHAGMPAGPYLVVPLLGGGTGRDMTGRLVNLFLDPLGSLAGNSTTAQLASLNWPMAALSGRAQNFDLINQVKRDSLDPYARVRALYYQQREALLADRVVTASQSAVKDDLFDSFFEKSAGTP